MAQQKMAWHVNRNKNAGQQKLSTAQQARQSDAKDQLEYLMAPLGLDDKCTRLLNSLDPSEAYEILKSMEGKLVTNQSAYITKACNDRMHGGGPRLKATAAKVEQSIENLGLDEKSSSLLRSLNPTDALDLLMSMPDDVRKPSAYITKAANDRTHGKVRGSGTASVDQMAMNQWQEERMPMNPMAGMMQTMMSNMMGQGARPRGGNRVAQKVENAIQSMGLDKKCSNKLRSLDPADAMDIIDSMEGETVSNPSAFIMKACNDRVHGKNPIKRAQEQGMADQEQGAKMDMMGMMETWMDMMGQRAMPRGGNRVAQKVDNAILSMGLDRNCSNKLRSLDPADAMDIIDSIEGETVSNPSAFITKACNDRLNGKNPIKRSSQSMYGIADQNQGWNPMETWMDMMGQTAKPRGGNRVAQKVENAIQSMGLDKKCSSLLRSLDPADAMDIVDSVEGATISNPSAFITKACNDRFNGKNPIKRASSSMADMVSMTAMAGMVRSMSTIEDEVQGYLMSLGVDDKASSMLLQDFSPVEALALLKDMPENVRNPSSYITKAVNDRKHSSDAEHRLQRLATMSEALGLDERAMTALTELSPDDAWDVLDRLSKKDMIKNPSAYVIKAVSGIQKEGVHLPPPTRLRQL